jgi:hypothetical protein
MWSQLSVAAISGTKVAKLHLKDLLSDLQKAMKSRAVISPSSLAQLAQAIQAGKAEGAQQVLDSLTALAETTFAGTLNILVSNVFSHMRELSEEQAKKGGGAGKSGRCNICNKGVSEQRSMFFPFVYFPAAVFLSGVFSHVRDFYPRYLCRCYICVEFCAYAPLG